MKSNRAEARREGCREARGGVYAAFGMERNPTPTWGRLMAPFFDDVVGDQPGRKLVTAAVSGVAEASGGQFGAAMKPVRHPPEAHTPRAGFDVRLDGAGRAQRLQGAKIRQAIDAESALRRCGEQVVCHDVLGAAGISAMQASGAW
jgi:hypothetical protein